MPQVVLPMNHYFIVVHHIISHTMNIYVNKVAKCWNTCAHNNIKLTNYDPIYSRLLCVMRKKCQLQYIQ